MRSLIIMGGNVQDQEGLYPYYRLQEEGEVNVWWTTPHNREGIQGVDFKKVIGDEGRYVSPDWCGDPPPCDYDLIIIPGGAKLMEKQRLLLGVVEYIADWCAAGKPIGSICHGTQMLIEADAVKGKTVLGYYSIKKDIENAGGNFPDASIAVTDNMVSAAHYNDMVEWMAVTIKVAKEWIGNG